MGMNAARLSRSLQCLQRRRWLVMSLFIRMISLSIANRSGSENAPYHFVTHVIFLTQHLRKITQRDTWEMQHFLLLQKVAKLWDKLCDAWTMDWVTVGIY